MREIASTTRLHQIKYKDSMFKPFKPPTLVKQVNSDVTSASSSPHDGPPPAKKRRLEGAGSDVGPSRVEQFLKRAASITQSSRVPSRTPLETLPDASYALNQAPAKDEVYYNVLWRKPTNKKNKTWDGDGILRITGGFAFLQDENGRDLGKTACPGPLLPESALKIGGKDVEVESILSREDHLKGRHIRGMGHAGKQSAGNVALASHAVRPDGRGRPDSEGSANGSGMQYQQPRALWKPKPKIHEVDTNDDLPDKSTKAAAPSSLASRAKWKNPMKESTTMTKAEGSTPQPRHDPSAESALVMNRPPRKHVPKGKQVVDVVVDPVLSKKLRDHPRAGVKFLFDCVMGFKSDIGQGAILADDMGLGKTLQTIALIWTLMKQNPVHEAEPVIRKALIVCPVTLIKNWRKEFRKWLGNERIGVFIAEGKNQRITDFTRGKSYNVMIIGYERLRSVYEELQKGYGVDLVIADEGHRLKTAQSKSAQAIQSLSTRRRIILSGTPIQNDLGEFFSMVDFVNPDALGNLKSFTKNFDNPIGKSRQPGATEKELEKGEARSEELKEITASFILRRTADVLSKYLPMKTELVLMCKPTPAQAAVYKHVLASPVFQSALGSAENALQLITILKKVCNSPKLLTVDSSLDPEKVSLAADVASTLPPGLLRNGSHASTKLRVLDQLLHTIRSNTSEKVVLVSNFTSTLDLISQQLTANALPFLRLDGSTSSSKRQALVDTFNRTDSSTYFAFLLSAKAGGMGLNLIGASRLVLFDVDWNPAIDAQAMARIHRDGQKRPCFIYRLLMAGGLDEKIWQRQVTKLGLASSVLDGGGGGGGQGKSTNSFTRDELRDLFRLDEGERCQTHELIGCGCGGKGTPEEEVVMDDGEGGDGGALGTDGDVGGDADPADDNFANATVISSGEEEEDSASDLETITSKRHKRRAATRLSSPSVSQEDDAKRPQLIKASELDMEAQERAILASRSADRATTEGKKMQSLMRYSHVDTSGFTGTAGQEVDKNMDSLVNDEMLRNILRDEDNLVTFVFAKSTA